MPDDPYRPRAATALFPPARLEAFFRFSYAGCLIAVVVLSVWPRIDIVPMPENADKLYHAFAYAVIAGCGGLGFVTRRGRVRAIVLALAVGGLLEIIQTYLPNRTGGIDDMVANAAGILIGYGTARMVMRTLAKTRYGRTTE